MFALTGNDSCVTQPNFFEFKTLFLVIYHNL